MMPVLSAQALSVVRSGQEVLKDVSFSTAQGEVHALLGGNGAGKSTTLLTFLGFLAPVSGSVHVQGPGRKRECKRRPASNRLPARGGHPVWSPECL